MMAMIMGQRSVNALMGGSFGRSEPVAIHSPKHNRGRNKEGRRQVRRAENQQWRSRLERETL